MRDRHTLGVVIQELFLAFLVCPRDDQLILIVDTCPTDGCDCVLEDTFSRPFYRVWSYEVELTSRDLYELRIGWVTCKWSERINK
jgi:hypothetical protein